LSILGREADPIIAHMAMREVRKKIDWIVYPLMISNVVLFIINYSVNMEADNLSRHVVAYLKVGYSLLLMMFCV
jgi:hypothetical protein